jgi:hypothetical protein
MTSQASWAQILEVAMSHIQLSWRIQIPWISRYQLGKIGQLKRRELIAIVYCLGKFANIPFKTWAFFGSLKPAA